MMAGMRSRIPAVVVVVALLLGATGTLTACASDGESAATTTVLTPVVVEVTMTDNAFTPSGPLGFEQGDFVIFRFRNNGTVQHEGVVGDNFFQVGHAEHEHLAGMDMVNSVLLAPGEQGDVPYRFEQPGEYIIGCHVDTHYESGMRITFQVTATS